jgi:transposase, IS5 family
MKQLTLAAAGFDRYAKTTRRAGFLAEMERVVPWSALCALIEPFYPKPGNGRPPIGVERMLRIYFLQQWFNLSDPAQVSYLRCARLRLPRRVEARA